MTTDLSVRLAWHERGWDGPVSTRLQQRGCDVALHLHDRWASLHRYNEHPYPTTAMSAKMSLPGIDAARDVLGLSLEEIARAVQTNPSTLYRWREGETTPNQVSLERLRRLEDLAHEIDRSLEREQIGYWLDTRASIFGGRTPREMISAGRAETVLGALLSHRHLLRSLQAAERSNTGFADLMARDDLSLSAKAALALLDQRIEDLVQGMQTPAARAAAAKAFTTPPQVRIRAESVRKRTSQQR